MVLAAAMIIFFNFPIYGGCRLLCSVGRYVFCCSSVENFIIVANRRHCQAHVLLCCCALYLGKVGLNSHFAVFVSSSVVV